MLKFAVPQTQVREPVWSLAAARTWLCWRWRLQKAARRCCGSSLPSNCWCARSSKVTFVDGAGVGLDVERCGGLGLRRDVADNRHRRETCGSVAVDNVCRLRGRHPPLPADLIELGMSVDEEPPVGSGTLRTPSVWSWKLPTTALACG